MTILPQPNLLQQLGRQLRDSVLPGNCLLCAADSTSSLLCPACASDLPALPDALCPQCGIPTTFGERCGACLKQAPHFACTHALFRYDFPADRLIHALKYGHQLAVAGWLGERLAQRLQPPTCDLIIPLPLHPHRLCERGFNQSVEIARPISQAFNRPLALDYLSRCRATPPQAELALPERARNVRGAFTCSQEIGGKTVLLIDDVMTSGATVNEAARILRLHGASRVEVAVAVRALKH